MYFVTRSHRNNKCINVNNWKCKQIYLEWNCAFSLLKSVKECENVKCSCEMLFPHRWKLFVTPAFHAQQSHSCSWHAEKLTKFVFQNYTINLFPDTLKENEICINSMLSFIVIVSFCEWKNAVQYVGSWIVGFVFDSHQYVLSAPGIIQTVKQ